MREKELLLEEVLSEEGIGDPEIAEIPLPNAPLRFLAAAAALAVVLIAAQLAVLGAHSQFYAARAAANVARTDHLPAPRGDITDRGGVVLALNRPVFAVVLDLKKFSEDPDQANTLAAVEQVLGVSSADIMGQVKERDERQVTDPVVLAPDVASEQVIRLKSLALPSVAVVAGYERDYPQGEIFSSIIGYTNLANAKDLAADPDLTSRDEVGRAGVESYYDRELRGMPSVAVTLRDARGRVVGEQEKSSAASGAALRLTIDAGFQKYFYERVREGLLSLGRTAGGGIAINPQTGEILALVSFPSYDNNVFVLPGEAAKRKDVLTSDGEPLFNRMVSGQYNPGSTIKPLVGVAALAEGVVNTTREIFSPGYLELPNKYDSANPLRFLDWRWQGNVNLATALAYSSNVYFYTVGGGANGVAGLGITRLRDWWEKFGLGSPTGVDLPGEAKGFLPSPQWRAKALNKPWLLGDTFNVSIGQGDLLVTPLQLVGYIGAIANGGTAYAPHLAENTDSPKILEDLTALAPEIREVQNGMGAAVTDPRGTAYTLNDLPIQVAAKTGSAQIKNNQQENAFFVGYIPGESLARVGAPLSKQIAILVLVENSKEGSLNAVPIAKDIFNWYYWNRVANNRQ